MTTIGFIGAGDIGSQLARLAIRSGYDVVLSNSRGPETLRGLITELGAHASAATADGAAEADIAVISTPMSAVASITVAPLKGKVVIDTNNYYPERDGHIQALDEEATTTSEMLQAHLQDALIVKGFSHAGSRFLTKDSKPTGTPNRRAFAIAGDSAAAKSTVANLMDEFGFDVVDVGPLSEGWRIQRGTPGYADRFTAPELRKKLDEAKRYRDM